MEFINDYLVLVIVGICVCTGYVIKITFLSLDRYIPLLMAILGIILNVWMTNSFKAEIVLAGMFSGLASTGLHQVFKQLINSKNN